VSVSERPPNLGEGKHPLICENEVHYHLGLAHLAAGHDLEGQTWLTRASAPPGDNRQLPAEPAYWRAQALRTRCDEAGAAAALRQLLRSARRRAAQPQRIDYFATSLPAFGILEDDLGQRNLVECRYLESLARAGLGQRRPAARGLREVLTLDPGHEGAAWHLRALTEDRLLARQLELSFDPHLAVTRPSRRSQTCHTVSPQDGCKPARSFARSQ